MADATPSILLTNLQMTSRSGSELHTLEMARLFAGAGWEVSVYTLAAAYPLLASLRELDVTIITFGEERSLASRYDVLLAQHHVVCDYLWQCTDVLFDKVIVSVLGPSAEHEALPGLAGDADLLLFVSPETRDAHAMAGGDVPSLVFPNYATKEFLDHVPSPRPRPTDRPARIAVVSNHVVPELRELAGLLEGGRTIEFYGWQEMALEITPELLDAYDLVITIGRTVPACFATGVPVYCYDQFGGPGYLPSQDLGRHAYSNFSGRSDPRRLTAPELLADIDGRYGEALADLAALRGHATRNLAFDGHAARLLARLDTLEPRPRTGAAGPTEQVRSRMLCELQTRDILGGLARGELYFHTSSDDDLHMVGFRYRPNSRIDLDLATMLPPDRAGDVRLDPDEWPTRFYALAPTPTSSNAEHANDGIYEFCADDPQLRFGQPTTTISFASERLDVRESLRALYEQVNQLRAEREVTTRPASRLSALRHRLARPPRRDRPS